MIEVIVKSSMRHFHSPMWQLIIPIMLRKVIDVFFIKFNNIYLDYLVTEYSSVGIYINYILWHYS